MTDAHVATQLTWRRAALFLALLAGVVIVLLWRDVAHMVGIWWDSSTFNHCLILLPVIGWLVIDRWPQVRQLQPVAWGPGLVWIALALIVWMAGALSGVALLRHSGVIGALQGAVLTVLGPQVARGLMFPLFLMLLLVPFGEELVPMLQTLTAKITIALLGLSGIPARIDGILIATPGGLFAVAEACSGVKFLVAMAAFATLAANLCFTSALRRVVFVLFALLSAIFANGIRAFGTIALAQRWGTDFARGFDHIVYGWVFFGLVLALVMWVARRWFDRAPDAPAFDPARLLPTRWGQVSSVVAAFCGVAVVAGAALSAHALLNRAGALPERLTVTVPTGWSEVALERVEGWSAHYPDADVRTGSVLANMAQRGEPYVDVFLAAYAFQREGHEPVAYGNGAIRPDSGWRWIQDAPSVAGGATQLIAHPQLGRVVVARWYRIGGRMTASDAQAKLFATRDRVTLGDPRAVVLAVASTDGDGKAAERIAAYVTAAGGAEAIMVRAMATPAPLR